MAGNLIIVDNLDMGEEAKTKALQAKIGQLGFGKTALIIDGDALNVGFARASSNLGGLNLIPRSAPTSMTSCATRRWSSPAPRSRSWRHGSMAKKPEAKAVESAITTSSWRRTSPKSRPCCRSIMRSCSRSPMTRPSPRSRRRGSAVQCQRDQVNTILTKGKTKRWKGQPYTRRTRKKAIVTLADGPVDRHYERDLNHGAQSI
jgi:hypothetical protein